MKKIILLSNLLFSCIYEFNAQQNTILIIADDLSPEFLGVYGLSGDTAVTNNIRELAASGIRYTKAWAAPVCSPTRVGMQTGRYSFRTGVGNVISTNSDAQLDTAEMSIGKLLKYYAPTKFNTACIGKWHVHANTPTKRNYPKTMGFDYYSGNFNGAITDFYNYPIIRNGAVDTVKVYGTTQIVNEAIGYLDTAANKPFFLWLAFNAPHTPFHMPPSVLVNTTGLSGTAADISNNPSKYYKAAIEALDNEIGRLFVYLKTKNLYNNTNIIFIGDNGSPNQVAQIADQSKAKGTLYNYGSHVPFIVSGPAVVSPNRVSTALVNTHDIYATVLELSGFTNWKNSIPSTTSIDSRSFLSDIKNEKILIRQWIFSEIFSLMTPTTTDGKTIRNQDYHLIKYDNGTEAFYNQTLDKEESNDLLKGTMSTADWTNYIFLCDSITKLTGIGTCKAAPSGIANRNIENAIEIFPNPVENILKIKCNESNIESEIFDIQGKSVLKSKLKELDISALHNGIYFIKITTNHSQQFKFIKSK